MSLNDLEIRCVLLGVLQTATTKNAKSNLTIGKMLAIFWPLLHAFKLLQSINCF